MRILNKVNGDNQHQTNGSKNNSSKTWLGRAVTYLPSVQTCAVIGIVALAIASIFMSRTEKETPHSTLSSTRMPLALLCPTSQECQKIIAYQENVQSSMLPDQNSPLTTFPQNFSFFYMNGRQVLEDGSRGCYTNNLEALQSCKKHIEEVEQIVKKDKKIKSLVFIKKAFEGKGMPVEYTTDDNERKYVILGLNPLKLSNYRQAVDHLEQTVLSDRSFFQNHNEIISLIKELHKKVYSGLSEDSTLISGQYRQEPVVIRMDRLVDANCSSWKENLAEKHEATKKELALFEKSCQQYEEKNLRRGDYLNEIQGFELELWKKLVFIPPHYNKVPSLIERFAKQLKSYYATDVHPIALAAWAHCELIGIHPFIDGNGRVARLLMNTILVQNGYRPVVFSDEEEYKQALIANQKNPGSFAQYLADNVIPWNRRFNKKFSV